MLYPTHQKYGILFGILMIPLSIFLGFIPTLTFDMRAMDIIIILCACYMGMSGALFGARFPDIDSASSIPARRHPLIRKIFIMFNIKHRGKYSHDYMTIGLTFILLYLIMAFGGVKLLNILAAGNTIANYGTYLAGILFLYLVGEDLVDFLQWIANKLKNRKMWAILDAKRQLFSIGSVILLFLCLFVGGVISPKALINGQDLATTLTIATLIVVSFKIYILFAWAGAYSHLFADMTTKEGVYFFTKKLAPAKVILKFKKIPLIGSLLVPTNFTTNSGWEDFNAMVISIACIPAALIAIFVLFGFDLSWLLPGD